MSNADQAPLTVVKETQVRLFQALLVDPAFKAKVEAKNCKRRQDRTAKIKEADPSLNELAVMFGGIYQELSVGL